MCSYVNAVEFQRDGVQSTLNTCNNAFDTAISQRNACIDARDSYLGQLNSCLAAGNSTEANRQLWISYAKKRDALVKKLYRACGAKCKKVK